MSAGAPELAGLMARFSALSQRIDVLEACQQLRDSFVQLHDRVSLLEAAAAGAGNGSASHTSGDAAYQAALQDASPTQQRLAKELHDKGFSDFRFVRAPPEYYDRPLEFRRDVLEAASIHHLCKSIIMENTRAHPSVQGCEDPNNSKYYLVIVQYTARFHADKLKNHIHKLSQGKVGKQYYNMRLCDEAVSDELSGFEHNAVSPIGIKTQMPMVISHEILNLQPDFFWLGGGEVDLKLGLSAAEFVDKYQPMVVDCTYT